MQLLQKLFGAKAREASVDQLLAYEEELRDLTLPQIELAVSKAIDVEGPFPLDAASVKRLAPSIESLNRRKESRNDCQDCKGTGFKMIQHPDYGDPHIRLAVKCECRSHV
jgi:hypothetical protein